MRFGAGVVAARRFGAAALIDPEPVAVGSMGIGAWKLDATSIFAWAVVGIPLAWGVWETAESALILFK